MSRALSTGRSIWSRAIGPIRVYNREIDAVSISIDPKTGVCRYVIAEIKNSRNLSELEKAFEQLVENIKLLIKPEVVSQLMRSLSIGEFTCMESACEEACIVTMYSIDQSSKNALKKIFRETFSKEELSCNKIEVYDINDIIISIKGFTGKEKYIELFKTLNEILEKS